MGWQENLFGEDMPPEWMWALPDSLEDWFAEVERRREQKYGTSKDEDESSLMMSNELADEKRRS